jgi:hypothetical protein
MAPSKLSRDEPKNRSKNPSQQQDTMKIEHTYHLDRTPFDAIKYHGTNSDRILSHS